MDLMDPKERKVYLDSQDQGAERVSLDLLDPWDRKEILEGMATLVCLVNLERRVSQASLEEKELQD